MMCQGRQGWDEWRTSQAFSCPNELPLFDVTCVLPSIFTFTYGYKYMDVPKKMVNSKCCLPVLTMINCLRIILLDDLNQFIGIDILCSICCHIKKN
jgi:hypothetical protein